MAPQSITTDNFSYPMRLEHITEKTARAIYWAAWEMYPPGPGNPVSGMNAYQAFEAASDEHRKLARFQAQKAIETVLGCI